MRVKIRGTAAGPGGCFVSGDIMEVTEESGRHLCNTGQGSEVKDKTEVVEEKQAAKKSNKKK